MKKTPTIFERDWSGDRSRVVDQIHAGCEWVFAGEGVATRKIDGTCCLVKDGMLFKRRELKERQLAPDGFFLEDYDPVTKKTVGWVPVGDGEEDKWHREAWNALEYRMDGTCELVGPKVQGNPEEYAEHTLVYHSECEVYNPPLTFEAMREWLSGKDIEGLVWHHSDGRMAKIKLRDFGLQRNPA